MSENNLSKKKVLFCGPISHPTNSGRYMISGIEQLGYRVIWYDYRVHNNIEKDLMEIVEREKPRYIFTLRGEKLSPELIKKWRERGCITILWFTILRFEDWMLSFAREHNFVLTNAEHHVKYFREKGIRNIKWFHQGFAPEFFGIDGPGLSDEDRYYADVGMIGTMGGPLYIKRSDLAMKLIRNNINFKWWGPRLSRKLRNVRFFWGGVNRVWGGKAVYMKDFADVIRHIKIFIGQDANTSYQDNSLYLSNRSMAVLGCGGFYLCRRDPSVEFVYEVGKEIDVFDTDDEMIEKVRYYLKNEDERKRIALAGQRKVLNDYTYKKQMEKIFNWIHETSPEII